MPVPSGVASFTPQLGIPVDPALWAKSEGDHGVCYKLDSAHPALQAGGAYHGVLQAEVLQLAATGGGEEKTVVNLAVDTGEGHLVAALHAPLDGTAVQLPLNPDLSEFETAKVLKLAKELAHHLPDESPRASLVASLDSKLKTLNGASRPSVWQRV